MPKTIDTGLTQNIDNWWFVGAIPPWLPLSIISLRKFCNRVVSPEGAIALIFGGDRSQENLNLPTIRL